ncbi:MAG: YbaB/EbfC family nucleoid-associated protein [Clostridia bacterium]|nr:YbaB/EbfC family nucleoid-associated protein [Clostridia bacterium]
MKARLPQGYGNTGGGNMQSMLKQAQKMQEDMAAAQADLEQREYTATVGGGMVTATVDGTHLLKTIDLKPEAVDPDDTEMLADLIVAAVNEAVRKAQADSEETLGKITGGMKMPF